MTFPAAWDGTSPTRLDPTAASRRPDERDWDTLIHEQLIISKPLAAVMDSVTTELSSDHGGLMLTRLTFAAYLATMTDAGAAGTHGTLKILELTTGRHFFQAVDFNLTLLAGAGGLADTAAIVGAIGSVTAAVDNGTLTGTEADVLPSTAFTLSGGTLTLAGGTIVPKTVSCTELFLNFAAADAHSTADDTLQVDGTIGIIWTPWTA